LRDLQLNNQVPLLGAAIIEPPPTSGPFSGNPGAVRVNLRSKQDLPFWAFFTGESPTVEVTATASIIRSGTFCMFADEDRTMTGINLNGSAQLNLGCGMATNAAGSTAIDAGGSSSLKATPLTAVGGLDASNPKFAQSTLIPYTAEQQNPYANLADPSDKIAGKDCSAPAVPVNGSLSPGCFSSFNIDSAVTLQPGTYYVKNADVNFSSKARVTGTEVTIVLTGDGDSIGKFDMSGQAELTLRAPKQNSGADYPGMVFLRDDDRVTMDIIRINGGQTFNVEGGMYFPKTRLNFNGGSTLSSKCLQVVAQQLEFNGNATITNDCSSGYGSMFSGTFVRLVE
jgi:hypothetical protein